MPSELHSFKRLVLGLQPSASDRAMRLAAELAELLDLELLGLFLEDSGLRQFAGIPFAREFRPLGGGWRSFGVDQLTHDLEISIRGVERSFAQAVKDLARRSQFEVTRGPVREVLGSMSGAGDIVMIVEPASAAERVSAQFAGLIEAAFRSTAAVLLVPPRIVHTKGPIVAIAAAAGDPSIMTAAAIAVAAKETLVVIEAGKQARGKVDISRLATETGLTVQRIAGGELSSDPPACLEVMRSLQERLVVMARTPFDGAIASAIAAARQVPVLVIEPEKLQSGEGAPSR